MATYKPLIVEICPREPRASMCTKSGDAAEACQFVRDLGVDFRIVARQPDGTYKNRKATDDEMRETCRAIYCDSETDFDDMVNCEMYLIWEAANGVANEEDETA